MSTNNLDRTACICDVGYVNHEHNKEIIPEDNPEGSFCMACPDGMDCRAKGSTWSSVQARRGWWRNKTTQTKFYRCMREIHCEGTAGAGDALCMENMHGVLCALCVENHMRTSEYKCIICPDKNQATMFFIIVFIGGMCLLSLNIYVILHSGKDLLERQRKIREAYMNQNLPKNPKAFRDEDIELSLQGPPPPPKSFAFKLKIFVSFLQILTSISTSVFIQWPLSFKAVMQTLSVVNLDILTISSFSCVATNDYYLTFYTWLLSAPTMVLMLLGGYMVPKIMKLKYLTKSENIAHDKKEIRQQFWKILIFLLFLFYPAVSRNVASFFVCMDIYDVSYLRIKMSEVCYSDRWNAAMPLALCMIFVYPLGIPFFFYMLIHRKRHRLYEPGVEASLGFLYAGYARDCWWFEGADMLNKLIMTSCLAFFPLMTGVRETELIGGMIVLTSFLCSILWLKPYLRKGDDRLQMIAVTELYNFVFIGYVFKDEQELDTHTDVVLSIIMIGLMSFFVGYMGLQLYQHIRHWWKKARLEAKRLADGEHQFEDEAGSDSDNTGLNSKNEAMLAHIAEEYIHHKVLYLRGQEIGKPHSYDNMLEMLHTKQMDGLDEAEMVQAFFPCLRLEVNSITIENVRAANKGGKNDPYVKVVLYEDGIKSKLCKLRTAVIKNVKASDAVSFPERIRMFLPIAKKPYFTVLVRFYDWSLGADNFLGQVKLFTRNIQIDDNSIHKYPIHKDETRLKDKKRTDFKGICSAQIDFDPIDRLPEELDPHLDYVYEDVRQLMAEFVPLPWYPNTEDGTSGVTDSEHHAIDDNPFHNESSIATEDSLGGLDNLDNLDFDMEPMAPQPTSTDDTFNPEWNETAEPAAVVEGADDTSTSADFVVDFDENDF
jgi:hypothetical protein